MVILLHRYAFIVIQIEVKKVLKKILFILKSILLYIKFKNYFLLKNFKR